MKLSFIIFFILIYLLDSSADVLAQIETHEIVDIPLYDPPIMDDNQELNMPMSPMEFGNALLF